MRGLGAVALVCVGLLILVGTLSLLQSALIVSSGGFDPGPSALSIVLVWLPIAVSLGVGVWLIRRRHALAARWFDDSSPGIAFEPAIVLRLALIIVGVVFVARAIPGLFAAIGYGVVDSSDSLTGDHVSWDWINSVVSAMYPLVALVVGALLIAYSERLAHRLFPSRRIATAQPVLATQVCLRCGAVVETVDYRDDAAVWICDSCGASLRTRA